MKRAIPVSSACQSSISSSSRASADVKQLARQQAEALETRIREMQEMKATLDHLVHACAGDDRPDCPILADLGGAARQVFDQPPSITCATPVVKLDSSEAR